VQRPDIIAVDQLSAHASERFDVRIPRWLASMCRVDSRKDDDWQVVRPQRLTNRCESLVVGDAQGELRDGVRGSGNHRVAVDLGVWARFVRKASLDPDRQAGGSFQLAELTRLAEPDARGRSQRDGYLPPFGREWFYEFSAD
jgi:hypothetical protein